MRTRAASVVSAALGAALACDSTPTEDLPEAGMPEVGPGPDRPPPIRPPPPMAECMRASDCPPAATCQRTTCLGGMCGTENLEGDDERLAQTSGDCQRVTCQGGQLVSRPILSDAPADPDPSDCAVPICSSDGTSRAGRAEAGLPCFRDDRAPGLCDMNGACRVPEDAVFVDADAGVDGPDRGAPDAPYATISYALSQIERGNVIVRPGEYTNEVFPIVLEQGQRLRCYRGEATIRALFTIAGPLLRIWEPEVSVQGCNIEGTVRGDGAVSTYCIRVLGDLVDLTYNDVRNCRTGIAHVAERGLAAHNRLSNHTSAGVYVQEGSLTIRDNTFDTPNQSAVDISCLRAYPEVVGQDNATAEGLTVSCDECRGCPFE